MRVKTVGWGISLIFWIPAVAGTARGGAAAQAGGPPGPSRSPSSPSSPSTPSSFGKACPVLLFGVTLRGRILQGRDIVKSVSSSGSVACLLPDVKFKGHLFTAFTKPGLLEFSDFARVTIGCDHLFASDRDVIDLSREIHSSLLQVDVPPTFRLKTRLMNYLRNIARRDGGVWVLGAFQGHSCRPRPWPADATDIFARVSRSPVTAIRPHGPDDIGPYVVPDENLDVRAPAALPAGASPPGSGIPLPPEEMDFPGRSGR